MLKIHFEIQKDYRPIFYPPRLPYWNIEKNKNITYAYNEDYLYKYWPDAKIISIEEVDSVVYTNELPQPKWYREFYTV